MSQSTTEKACAPCASMPTMEPAIRRSDMVDSCGKFQEPGQPKKPASILKSRALWAFVFFLATCQLMQALELGKLKPVDFPYPTWTSWAIGEFLNERKPAELVFLGSSLMLVPLDGVDADFTKKQIDGARHHKSIFFESKFKEYSGSSVKTFNFALPGEMPSDAYLLTKFLLKDERRPEIIVYGVGPRDFMDNLLPSPRATDPFRYLSRLGDYNERIALVAPKWEERLGYELTRLFYPMAESENIMTSLSRYANNLIATSFPYVQPSDVHKRRLLLPDYHPFEIRLSECFFRPTTDENRPPFTDNIDEYRKRYKKLKWDTFLSQMQFLTDILDIANQRGTHVVVMAMPITDINRQLISDEAWSEYKTRLKALAQAKGASYLDMYESKAFPLKDFGDTVHLHSGGGAKLLDMLARELARDHAVMSKLDVVRTDRNSHSVAGIKDTGI